LLSNEVIYMQKITVFYPTIPYCEAIRDGSEYTEKIGEKFLEINKIMDDLGISVDLAKKSKYF